MVHIEWIKIPEDKQRDQVEERRLGDSRDASRWLENQMQDEQNLSKLPKKEQEKARQVLSELKPLIGKWDPESLATLNNLLKMNRELLNSIDPSLIIKINQEIRRVSQEKYREAARNGNVPVLTAGAMEYINQGSNIYAEIGKDLETRLQNEAREDSNDVQVAQFQTRVESVKQKLDLLYRSLAKLQTFGTNNVV